MLPDGETRGGVTATTFGVFATASLTAVCAASLFWLGSSVAISSGPLKPPPKPRASRSNAWRVFVPDGSLPASLLSRRRPNTGSRHRIIRPHERTASGHGRRWTVRLHSRQREWCGALSCTTAAAVLARRRPNGSRRVRGRTIRSPYFDSIAGSTVSDANIVASTANTEEIARPYRKLTPVTNIPSSAIITVVPARRTARPDV